MPDYLWLAAALIIGFILGLVPAMMLARQRLETARQAGREEQARELAVLQERLVNREQQLQQRSNEFDSQTAKYEQLLFEKTALERESSRLAAELKDEVKRSEEKLNILNDARNELQAQFQNLANRIFEEKTRAFADQSRANLDIILNPFKEKITEFEKKVTEVYTTEGKERHSLIKEVQRLQELNQRISEDADNLTRALKGDSQAQGAWGEMILERILEESGLRKGSEYDTQGGFRDAEGRLQKPDVIVHLPDKKQIVIDSKVSLIAYDRYIRAETDEDRERAVNDHLLSINSHLKGLESKKYDELPGVNSLDFVLMFIPIESAFMLAIDRDNEIFRKAFDKSIMIVSPSTLLVTLRTIENIWRYEHQNKNALEIADRAKRLHEKFVGFIEDIEKVGVQLETTRSTYDAARNKLVSGRGNLVSQAETLIALGVKSRKQIPASIQQHVDLEPALTEAAGDESD